MTLIVDEQVRAFDNTSELLLPAVSAGRNALDASELQFFNFDQSYDYRSRSHAVQVLAEPTARLDVRAGWRLEDLDLDFASREDVRGTSFGGTPFSISRGGPGAIERDIEIANLEIGFTVTERVRLVGEARRSTLEQHGSLAIGSDLGSGAWSIATDGFEVGAEVAISAAVVVAAGLSSERQTTNRDWAYNARGAADEAGPDRQGYFARLRLNFAAGLELTASVEDNDIDDPFTLASPTSSRRYKGGVRRRWSNGLALSGNYRRTDVENERSHWLADTEQADVRVMYERPRLQLSAGYTRGDLARSIEQSVTAGTRLVVFSIDYAAASTFGDVSGRWQINDRVAIGGDVRWYDNDGSFAVTRDDDRAFLDWRVNAAYSVQIAYRNVEYTEDAYDAYDSRILEVAFGMSW